MSAPSRRIAVVSALVLTALVGPALPVFGAVFDGSMAARAGVGAERSRTTTFVGTPAPSSDVELVVAEVVRLTNLERAVVGLPPLDVHPAVAAAASAHSADQAAMQRMGHTGSDGSDAGVRLTRAGFRWQTWGENVAAGQRTAAEVVDAWMGSSGHRANVLNGSFTVIGVGLASDASGSRYWTMVLAA